ncbi:hypothetical protein [Streptomyces sp. PU-14G]|uniref:hypothetical protein n=1 Tax=Streptomyces sp. PU-14G TaxID=2800808 RepID=UPI0034DFE438
MSASVSAHLLILVLGAGGLLISLLAVHLLAWPAGSEAAVLVALLSAAATLGALFSPVQEHAGPNSGIGWLPNVFVAVGGGCGLVGGLLLGLPFGLPNAVATALGTALQGGLAGALTAGCVIGLGTRPGLGAVCGLAFGTSLATGGALRWRYTTARTLLVVRRRLPWRPMRSLADAHARRGILRRVGTVCQFRHLALQRHLAGRNNS